MQSRFRFYRGAVGHDDIAVLSEIIELTAEDGPDLLAMLVEDELRRAVRALPGDIDRERVIGIADEAERIAASHRLVHPWLVGLLPEGVGDLLPVLELLALVEQVL